MPLREWRSIERFGQLPGKWIECEFQDDNHSAQASSAMFENDETIYCIHRRYTEPDTERPKMSSGNKLETKGTDQE